MAGPAEKSRHIMILTGEPSGDFHAGNLIEEIQKIEKGLTFSGIGGPALSRRNVKLFFHIEKLSVMGITEVILQFSQIKNAFDAFKTELKSRRPDLVIIIDYPGFNLRAAKYIKAYNRRIPVLYYILPKVWAWKKNRLKQIRRYVDHAALIFPFESKIYRTAGIPATYVGNPLIEDYPANKTKMFSHTGTRQKKERVIGLLPGSRRTEVNNLLDTMMQSAKRISQHYPDSRFIISKAASVDKNIFERILLPYNGIVRYSLSEGPVNDIFHQTDFLVAASGTVTLEAALACVPTILIYKMSAVSYRIARFLVDLEFAGLANLIAGHEVMPEFLQEKARASVISEKAVEMLGNLDFYQKQLQSVRQFLGGPGASKRAAQIAVQMLN